MRQQQRCSLITTCVLPTRLDAQRHRRPHVHSSDTERREPSRCRSRRRPSAALVSWKRGSLNKDGRLAWVTLFWFFFPPLREQKWCCGLGGDNQVVSEIMMFAGTLRSSAADVFFLKKSFRVKGSLPREDRCFITGSSCQRALHPQAALF